MMILRSRMLLPAVLALVLTQTSCGGGGNSNATFSIDKTSINFVGVTPDAAVPDEVVSGTVDGNIKGTLYLIASVSGNAVGNITNFEVSGKNGRAIVSAPHQFYPGVLPVGHYSATITVRACVNDITCNTGELRGSPQTIAVSYTAGAPVPNAVWPHVLTAGSAGQVVIRGHSLSNTSSVLFGTTPATSISVISDSEVRATYPSSLATGNASVVLNNGAIAFSGSVNVINPTTFPAQRIPFPEVPSSISRVVFDPERNTLFVAAYTSTSSKIWQFPFVGNAWGSPATLAIPLTQDIALSSNNSRLLVLTTGSLIELDASNITRQLAVHNSPNPPSNRPVPDGRYGDSFYSFAPTNDGNVLITSTLCCGAGLNTTYIYSSSLDLLQPMWSLDVNTDEGVVTAVGDGSRALIMQAGLPLDYNSTTQRIRSTSFPDGKRIPVAADFSGSKIGIIRGISQGTNFAYTCFIYDGNASLLGTLSDTAETAVMNSSGTRLHTLGSDGAFRSYDLNAPLAQGGFQQLGSSIPLTAPLVAQGQVRTAITPDGGTVFVATKNGIDVLTVPK